MKYLIFGASGFLGKALVSYLKTNGEQVITVQRSGAEKYNVDIANNSSFNILNEVEGVDIIINCASVLPDFNKKVNDVDYIEALYKTNVVGGVNILNFAAKKNINRVINCSTLVVNKKPWPIPLAEDYISLPVGNHAGYASSKLMQEVMMNEVAALHGLQLLHLRISALYGETMKWQGILPQLIDKALKGEKVTLWNANKTSFDFLWVDDLVNIIYRICHLDHWQYKTVNAASGEEIFLEDLADKIIRYSHSNTEIEYLENEQPISRAKINITLLKKMMGGDLKLLPNDEGIKRMINSRAGL